MATMIIVEDESFERNALKNCIDWELVGVKIVGEAANGAQGLSMAMELKPDIVLTDVNMPVMNAIEMTERIRRFLPETKILFLSSYDDFDYARQGIDLGIFSYITKPVKEMELLRSVKKAVDQITEKELEKKLYSKIKNNYEMSLKLAKQAFISRILMNIAVDKEEAAQMDLIWMCGEAAGLGLIVTAFEEEKTEYLDKALDELTNRCQRFCKKPVNICFTKGNLVTIFLTGQEETVTKVGNLIKDFLSEKQCRLLRQEWAYDGTGEQCAGQLYDGIWQRSLRFADIPVEAETEKKRGKQQIVAEVENIIRTQYAASLSIETIAKAMHFTPNYLGTVFKTVKGIGINRYLMNVRMENAQKLLRESSISVSEIALQCGFDNVTYFHSSFKKETGMTPSEYREAYAIHGNTGTI